MADTPGEARRFVERYGWTWPSVRDPDRQLANRLGANYQPHFILVDADGRIAGSHEGGGDAEVWDSLVARLAQPG